MSSRNALGNYHAEDIQNVYFSQANENSNKTGEAIGNRNSKNIQVVHFSQVKDKYKNTNDGVRIKPL